MAPARRAKVQAIMEKNRRVQAGRADRTAAELAKFLREDEQAGPALQAEKDEAKKAEAIKAWFRCSLLAGIPQPCNLKHVRQPVLSRISQLKTCVLKTIREPRKRKDRGIVLDDIKGPPNLKSIKYGQPRVLILTDTRQGRADSNLKHV